MDRSTVDEVVALHDTGDKKGIAKAYRLVRQINKRIKTTEQCESQIAAWKKEMASEETSAISSSSEDAVMKAVADRVRLMDEHTLTLLKQFEMTGEKINDREDRPEDLAVELMDAYIAALRAGYNPTTLLATAIRLRGECLLDEFGQPVKPAPNVEEAVYNGMDATHHNLIEHMMRML